MTMRIINSTAVNQNIIQCSLHKILNFSGKRYRIKNRKTFFEQENCSYYIYRNCIFLHPKTAHARLQKLEHCRLPITNENDN